MLPGACELLQAHHEEGGVKKLVALLDEHHSWEAKHFGYNVTECLRTPIKSLRTGSFGLSNLHVFAFQDVKPA